MRGGGANRRAVGCLTRQSCKPSAKEKYFPVHYLCKQPLRSVSDRHMVRSSDHNDPQVPITQNNDQRPAVRLEDMTFIPAFTHSEISSGIRHAQLWSRLASTFNQLHDLYNILIAEIDKIYVISTKLFCLQMMSLASQLSASDTQSQKIHHK